MNLKKFLRLFVLKFISLLLSLLFVCSVPFLLVLLSPIYLFRFILFKLAPVFRKDLGKMLSARSSVMTGDQLFKRPRASLLATGILEGDVDLNEAQKTIWEKIITVKGESGELIYPEFRQYLYKWWGFYFWKSDPNFDISYHVTYYNDGKEKVSKSELNKVHADFMLKPFSKEKALWELLIVRNYDAGLAHSNTRNDLDNNSQNEKDRDETEENGESRKSVFLWKVHHTLGDGYSFAKVCIKLCGESKDLISTPGKENNEVETSRCLYWLKFVFTSVYSEIYQTIEAFDFNAWHSPLKTHSGDASKALAAPISLEKLKEVAKELKVGLSSVILAGMAGGVKRYMEQKNVNLPSIMHCAMPFPFPNHPDDKLRNYYSAAFLRIKMRGASMEKRLKKIEERFQHLKDSPAPVFVFLAIPFLGGLFPSWIKYVFENRVSTLNMTSFPGPNRPLTLFGLKLTTLYIDVSFIPGSSPLVFTTVTYAGNLYMSCTGDIRFFPTETEASSLLNSITQEFLSMHATFAV